MARGTAPLTEKSTDEQWETTTQAMIWVKVTAKNGDLRQVKVGGRKGARFRISYDDRLANQDEVIASEHDPFTNGLLYRIKGTEPVHPPLQSDFSIENLDAPQPEAEHMMGFQELRAILGKHGNAFRAKVAQLNEVNLRRLVDIARELPDEQGLTVAQQSAIDELMVAYRPGGQQPSYAEFMRGSTGPAVSAAGTPL